MTAIRRIWTSLRSSFAGRLVRRAHGAFPLTSLSLIALPVLGWVYWAFAEKRHDRILLAMSLSGAVLVAVQAAQVVLAALWLRVRPQRDRSPLELETGSPARTGWTVGLIRFHPLLRVEVAWLAPMATVELAGGETVVCETRGSFERIVRRMTVSDVLGLARITFQRKSKRSVVVRPGTGRVGRVELVAQDVPGDAVSSPNGQPQGDLIEMRQYVPGDPLKRVLWKLYARTGRLMVRVPERAVAASPRTLAYFVAAANDEPAAGVARALLENGSLGGDMIFGADGVAGTTGDVREAVERVVQARNDGASTFASFLKFGEKSGVAACVVFVPPTPGRWLSETIAHIGRFKGACRAVIGCDEIDDSARPSRLRRTLLKTKRPVGPSSAGLREVVAQLRTAGCDVLIVDRQSGEVKQPV